MRKILFIAIGFFAVFLSCKSEKVQDVPAPVPHDPFIMLYNDTYYAYGTNAANGIVYTSDNLNEWTLSDQIPGGLCTQKRRCLGGQMVLGSGSINCRERSVLYVLLGRRAYMCRHIRSARGTFCAGRSKTDD